MLMEGDLRLAMKMQGEEQVEKWCSWGCKVLPVSPPWTSRCHPEYLCLKTLSCPHCRLGMRESYEATPSPAALQQWLTASSLPSFGCVTLCVLHCPPGFPCGIQLQLSMVATGLITPQAAFPPCFTSYLPDKHHLSNCCLRVCF